MEVDEIVRTDSGNFVIRPYLPEDEAGVLTLWEAAFQKQLHPALWRWKYLENPYDRQIMLCVSEKGIPVAMYSGIPYRAVFKGEPTHFTHLMDNVSHPAFRGVIGGRRGLFVRTADALFDRWGGPHCSIFIYGFPGERHFLLGKRILKYTALSNNLSHMGVSAAELARRKLPFVGKIEPLMEIDGALDDQLKEARAYYPFAVFRDASFIDWRFMRHPEKTYRIWVYRSYFRKELKGYAVFSYEDDKAVMIDILMPPSNRTIQDFLARLGNELVRKGLNRIETLLPKNHFLTHAAKSAGFEIIEDQPIFVPTGRIFHPTLSFDWINENIFYTMADGDLY